MFQYIMRSENRLLNIARHGYECAQPSQCYKSHVTLRILQQRHTCKELFWSKYFLHKLGTRGGQTAAG